MKEKTKAYMGGLIDGEGSLGISKSSRLGTDSKLYHSVVGLSNTNPIITKWAVKHFGGVYRKRERPSESDNAGFEWYLTGCKSQRFFLEMIRPYVRFKKLQVDLLLQYLDLFNQTNPLERDRLYCALKTCHHNFSVETDTLDPLSKAGRPYYSALLDGEGSITISKDVYGHFRPAVRVYNSNLALLTPLKNKWGGNIHEDRPDFYQWYINRKETIEKFLLYNTPYILAKRAQAKTMLEYARLSRKWNQSERNRLYEQMIYLNNLKVKIQSELTGDRESEVVGIQLS